MGARPDTTSNERIARSVPEDIATQRNLDLIDGVYAGDAVEHDPSGDHEGLAAIREQMTGLLEAVPDFSASVEDVVSEGDMVAMRVPLRGTPESPFMGIEATGKRFEAENVVFTRIEDGKIAERWVQPDMRGMLSQLGAVEAPWS